MITLDTDRFPSLSTTGLWSSYYTSPFHWRGSTRTDLLNIINFSLGLTNGSSVALRISPRSAGYAFDAYLVNRDERVNLSSSGYICLVL